MSCPSDEALAALVDNPRDEERAAMERHFDECPSCRVVAATLVRGLFAPADAEIQSPAAPLPFLADPTASLPRGTEVGRYLVVDRVGVGGMGVVYAAYDPKLDRKVAIKLLRAHATQPGGPEKAHALLDAEAKAMARLSHRNVLAVYDWGRFGEHVFVVMEFVEGVTLRRWLEQHTARDEIVRVLVAAGRGLAAAHAAGLVHRDFKPENVLIGSDGRVCVSDFGLATHAVARPGEGRHAATAGTLAYLAPEQRRGAAPDARADQFSFAVVLHEALLGRRPMPTRGEPSPSPLPDAPARRLLDRRLRRVLERGLQADPARRFTTMSELIDALKPKPRRRLAPVAIACALLGVVGGWASYRHRERAQLCRGAERHWAGIWDEATQALVTRGFTASGARNAASVLGVVRGALDRYRASWIATHQAACEATRLRGEQSDEVLSLRMACLERRRSEAQALVEMFARADTRTVAMAPAAVEALTPVARCSDVEVLRTRVAAPASAEGKRELEWIEDKLSRGWARYETGHLDESKALEEEALAAARRIHYAPAEAKALLQIAGRESTLGRLEQAVEHAWQALARAEAASDDRRIAQSSMSLIKWSGQVRRDDRLVSRLESLADAAIERLGGDDELNASLAGARGMVAFQNGQTADAVRLGEVSLALMNRVHAADDAAIVEALSNQGAYLSHGGRYAESIELLRRALAIRERKLGPDSQEVAGALTNIAATYDEMHQPKEALPYLERALAIAERVLPTDSAQVADCASNLGTEMVALGRPEEALTYLRRALAIYEQSLGANRSACAYPLTEIGRALVATGRAAAAIAPLERALALRQSNPVLANELGLTRFALGRARWATGEKRRARELVRQAVREFDNPLDLAEARRWQAEHAEAR